MKLSTALRITLATALGLLLAIGVQHLRPHAAAEGWIALHAGPRALQRVTPPALRLPTSAPAEQPARARAEAIAAYVRSRSPKTRLALAQAYFPELASHDAKRPPGGHPLRTRRNADGSLTVSTRGLDFALRELAAPAQPAAEVGALFVSPTRFWAPAGEATPRADGFVSPRLDEYWVSDAAKGLERARYALTVPQEVRLVHDAGDYLELLGANGRPVLRFHPAVARGADGSFRQGELRLAGVERVGDRRYRLTGRTLEIETGVRLDGLSAPVVVDPGFSSTGSLSGPREESSAALLPDGEVLVMGGKDGTGNLASAERYDPASGTWSATGSLAGPRIDFTATLLPNGKVLVAGGYNGAALSSAELYDPASGIWSSTGALATGRFCATATLLTSGKVLVAGGNSGSTYLSSAELYDPASGTWSPTGSLASARYIATATLLPDGRVLVAGGYNGFEVGAAELYDPTSGTWSPTGSLASARRLAMATLLPNGKVLLAGGYGGGAYLRSAELYDPTSGTWAPTGSLASAHYAGSATLLPDGSVLVAGGFDGTSYLGTAERYAPASGTWSPAGALATARYFVNVTLLPSGQVLFAGGFNGSFLSSTELYDPGSGGWASTGSLSGAHYLATQTLLPNGKVLVAGGYQGSNVYLSTAELYDPTSGTWAPTGSLATARHRATATLLPNGKVLVAGGSNASSLLGSAELYDPVSGTWAPTGSLTDPREAATATLLANGKVLVVGGSGSTGFLSSAELYDPASGTWAPTGSLQTARYHATATLLQDGRVLVAAGYGDAGNLASAELYDPATGSWSPTGSLSIARDGPTAALLADGKVLVVGGYASGPSSSAELYDPSSGTWSPTGSLATGRHDVGAVLLPSGKVLVAGGSGASYLGSVEIYDPVSGTWSPDGALATARMDATATLLPNGKVLVAAGYDGSYLSSAELYDPTGASDAWRPVVTAVTSLRAGGSATVTGTGFRGISGASSGTFQDSPTDFPLVSLQSIEGGQRVVVPGAAFSATSVTLPNLPNLPGGHYVLSVTANAIPGGKVVSFVPNQPPAASNGSATLAEDTSADVTLIASDPDGDPLTYSIATPPANGTLSLSGNVATYTPAADFNGTDLFTFRVSDGSLVSTANVALTVTPVNDAPVAQDTSLTVAEDGAQDVVLQATDVENDTLTYSIVSPPAHGTFSLTGNTVTYRPNPDFNGTDSFSFQANDGQADSSAATVSVTVTPVNDAPVATNGGGTTAEDTATDVSLEASDVDADALTYSVATPPAHGSVTISGSTATYTPTANYNGADSFTFKANDGTVDSNVATISLTVTPVNDAPVAQGASATTDEDTATDLTLQSTDVDGDLVSYSVVTPPAHGSVSISGSTATYTPAADYNGTDSFTFKANDGTVDSNVATASINILPVNDAPVATNGSGTTAEDTATDVALQASDVDGDTLGFSVVTPPAHGSVSIAGSTATYTPAADYNGADSFTFKANDGTVDSNVATVSLTVTAVNDAPVATNGSATTPEDTATDIALQATDVEGDGLTYSIVTPPAHGSVSIAGSTATYTPAADYDGADSFTFKANDGSVDSNAATVSLTVTAVNDAPVATNGNAITNEDTAIDIALQATDAEGDALTYSLVDPPLNGTVTIVGSTATYTPAANYNGLDGFTFKANDGKADSNLASVLISVTAVNDAPVAQDGSATTNEDTAADIALQATDVEIDGLTFSVVTPPAHGSVSISGSTATYTPAANYHGADGFTFKANDGTDDSNVATVSLTVTSVNDAPVAQDGSGTTAEDTATDVTLQASDVEGDALSFVVVTQPTHGTVSLSGSTATYTPAADYNGADSFTFKANDGTVDSNVATVSLTVTAVNDAPVAQDGSATTGEDTATDVALQASDVDGDGLSFVVVTPPAHGTVSLSGATATYTPAANFHGADSFTFKANDGTADSSVATVSLTVTSVNDAPVAQDGSGTSAEDTATEVALQASDGDGDALGYTVVTQPAHGTVSLSGSTATYTPAANFHGADSFTFKANDGAADSNVATVSLTITSVNDSPVAQAGSATTAEDGSVDVALEASDVDGDPLSYIVMTPPAHGTLTLSGATATYSPAADFNGADSFTFKANDGTADSNVSTVSLSVTAVNDAPIAAAASATTAEDSAVDVVLQASDVDGDPLSYVVVTPPAHGTVSLSGSTAIYTPSANYDGTDSFTFKTSDGTADSNVQTVALTITAVNDAPVAQDASATTSEDTATEIALQASDADGDALTYAIVTPPEHGTVSLSGASATYTPEANYDGPDSFSFKTNDGALDSAVATVALTVSAVDDPPTAPTLGAPSANAVLSQGRVTFDWSPATDIEGDALHYRLEILQGDAVVTTIDSETTTATARLSGWKYSWRVIAIDADGAESPPSETRPLTVQGLATAAAGCTSSGSGSPMAGLTLLALLVLPLLRRRRV